MHRRRDRGPSVVVVAQAQVPAVGEVSPRLPVRETGLGDSNSPGHQGSPSKAGKEASWIGFL